MAVYAAQIDRMDQGIGRVLDKVRQLGQEDNTLILFLADNGGCHEENIAGEKKGRAAGTGGFVHQLWPPVGEREQYAVPACTSTGCTKAASRRR